MIVTRDEFNKVYLEYYNKLYKVALRIAGNTHDAEDVLQETYLNAYNSLEKFRLNSSISTWLYRITVNCSLQYIKTVKAFPVTAIAKDKGVSEFDFFIGLRDYKEVEDEALYNDMRETCLQMFIECLPRKQRVAFVLKVLMELSIREVSEILGISESAVKTNVHRARNAMKNALDGKCAFLDPGYPCQCKLWVNYAIENNKRHLIPNFNAKKRLPDEISEEVLSEIHFLRKISVLYNSEYNSSGEEFLKRMKDRILKKDLKIFE